MISLKNINKFNSVIKKNDHLGKVQRICTDTRNYQEGDLFVAISGEKFNAFLLIEGILKKGCQLVVYSESLENEKKLLEYKDQYSEVNFIAVTDSILFLQELAKDHRESLSKINPDLKIISISGSNGKTTCKEMLKFFCEEILGKDFVIGTEKNNNNHLGVPLTLLNLKPTTKVGIIELGSNHPGEIPLLHKMVRADYLYVTNIGETHIEFFKNLEAVFKEEAYPLFNLPENSMGWVNIDDHYLKNIPSASGLIRVGEAKKSFTCGNDFLILNGEKFCNSFLLGHYNYHNLAMMMIMTKEVLKLNDYQKLGELALGFKPSLMRSQWLKINEKNIFLDAYNANPSSMELAIKAFYSYLEDRQVPREKVLFIIGDMLELGENSCVMHEKLARNISLLMIENIVFIGEFAKDYQLGWEKPHGRAYKTIEAFKGDKEFNFKDFDFIFLKASRSLQFESILDII